RGEGSVGGGLSPPRGGGHRPAAEGKDPKRDGRYGRLLFHPRSDVGSRRGGEAPHGGLAQTVAGSSGALGEAVELGSRGDRGSAKVGGGTRQDGTGESRAARAGSGHWWHSKPRHRRNPGVGRPG